MPKHFDVSVTDPQDHSVNVSRVSAKHEEILFERVGALEAMGYEVKVLNHEDQGCPLRELML